MVFKKKEVTVAVATPAPAAGKWFIPFWAKKTATKWTTTKTSKNVPAKWAKAPVKGKARTY